MSWAHPPVLFISPQTNFLFMRHRGCTVVFPLGPTMFFYLAPPFQKELADEMSTLEPSFCVYSLLTLFIGFQIQIINCRLRLPITYVGVLSAKLLCCKERHWRHFLHRCWVLRYLKLLEYSKVLETLWGQGRFPTDPILGLWCSGITTEFSWDLWCFLLTPPSLNLMKTWNALIHFSLKYLTTNTFYV